MSAAAEGPENAIRAVVVLTDGQANRGQTHLDDLVVLTFGGESSIREFRGFNQDQSAMNAAGEVIAKEDIVATEISGDVRCGGGFARGRDHACDVQVFYLGIGGDADIEVGRILAQATGAEFQGVVKADLARVLEEFSRYF